MNASTSRETKHTMVCAFCSVLSHNPQFLSLKGPDSDEHTVECMEHMEKFWYWLKARGVTSYRSGIVKAVAVKASTFFPDIYDASIYEDEDDDDDED